MNKIRWYQVWKINLKTIRKLEKMLESEKESTKNYIDLNHFLMNEIDNQNSYIHTLERKVLKKAIIEDRI